MEKIIIFGAGEVGRRALYEMGKYECVVAFLDNDCKKQGEKISGINILNPKELKSVEFDKILIASFSFLEIANQLIN